jgi:glycosyltransferase involved in cell wall biosynthesis
VTTLYFADIRFPLERANGIQTMETCHALARKGHTVTLVVRPDTQSPARDPFAFYGLPRIDTLHIERAPVTGPAMARRAGYLAFALGRVMGAGRADAVITRDLGLASALLRIPRASRPPLVYESHGYAPDVALALPQLVSTATAPGRAKLARLARREARVWRLADGYVTITSGLADALRARLGSRERLAIVPDGTRLSAADAERVVPPPPGHRKPVVAYAGHLYAWKGVDVLLDAIANLPDVEGLIVGGHEAEPDLERARARAAGLGIRERVRFTGMVAPTEVADLLRGADVLVLPNPPSAISTQFTSPLKLFEYMAAGRPIVASDLPAIREVLEDNVTALLVPGGDAAAIAAAVRRLIDDPALGARLARWAALAVRDYSWDRRAERIETLLRQVASPQG